MKKIFVSLILLLSFFTNAEPDTCGAEVYYDLNADNIVFLIGSDRPTAGFINMSQHSNMLADCTESFINMITHGDSVISIAGQEVAIKYVLSPKKIVQLQSEDLIKILNSLQSNSNSISYEFRLSSEQEGEGDISFIKKSP